MAESANNVTSGAANSAETLQDAGDKTIRVIEVHRSLIDVGSASEEELAIVLARIRELMPMPEPPHEETMKAFLNIARLMQGPLAPLLTSGPGAGDRTKEDEETLPSIVVRNLLSNPAVLPIIAARGGAAALDRPGAAKTESNIRTRAASRVRAISPDGLDIAVAAEEPIEILGFAVDPAAAGAAVLEGMGIPFLGVGTYVSSGSYKSALLAAASRPHPPESIDSDATAVAVAVAVRLARRGFGVTLLRQGVGAASALTPSQKVILLIRQSRAAIEFYLSGAATAMALSNVAAAARGRSGAPPEYLTAVSPTVPVLSLGDGLVTSDSDSRSDSRGPTWRARPDEDRLRYLLGRLANTEPVAAGEAGTWAFDLNPINDLFRVGALGVYQFALSSGRESSELDSFLEQMAIRHAKTSQLDELKQLAVVATSRARQMVTIIEDKFGVNRVNAVLNALRTAIGSRSRGAPGGSLAQASDSVQVNNPEAVLALLSKREKEVVLTEFDNRLQAWESSVNNKCPHVRLARKLRESRSAEAALATLRELSKYFAADHGKRDSSEGRKSRTQTRPQPQPRTKGAPGAAESTWLACRSCAYRALCPHVRERIQLEGRREPYDEIRTQLFKYAVRVRASGDSDSYAYFCRICSERLSEATDDNSAEQVGRFGDLDSGLKTRIWSTALMAARNVLFSTPTDERQFAATVAATVYPVLMAAEEAITKKGRRRRAPRTGDIDDDEEIDPRTQLYIILFVYAYILDLIRTSREFRSQEIGFVGVKAGAKEGVYAERMLRLIAEEHRGIISQIEDISAEFLRARFTESYRLVRGESSNTLQTANPEEELAVQTTTMDPIYRYATTVARVAGDLPAARPAGPAEARREFETALGSKLPDIVKAARESAKDPTLAPLYLRRTGVEVPPGGALEYLLKDPRVNLYTDIYEPKKGAAGADAVAAFVGIASAAIIPAPGIRHWVGAAQPKRGHPKRHPAPGHRDKKPAHTLRPENALRLVERGYFFEAYRLFVWYTKGLTSQDEYDAYQAELAAFRRSEDGLRVSRAMAAVKSYYDFNFVRSQQFVPTDVAITSIYDEEGRPHDWSKKVTYYYVTVGTTVAASAAAAPEIEVKGGPEGVMAARKNGTVTSNMVIADLGCPICGTRVSQLGKLNVEKTWQSVRATSEMDSFFVFYESRCPAGELHAWENSKDGMTCRRCGLSAVIAKEVASGNAKSKNAREYYTRYAERFASERNESRQKVSSNTPAKARPAPSTADASTWKADYTYIVRAAALANVTPATIEAIGSMEGREYGDIIEGRGVPPLPTSPSDPRIYSVDAEVRLFLSEYSQLRNAVRILKPPLPLLELISSAGVSKHEWGKLSEVLPVVGEGYRDMFVAVLRDRPPADALAFAIQSLCEMVLTVSATVGSASWTSQLATTFAKQTLLLILRGQALFSKPGTFNWAIFETGDDTVQDQVGDVGEDIMEEILGADTEEAPDDPFSGENMDYDTSENEPNNEPE